MSVTTVSPPRQRMIEDMSLRNLAPRTQETGKAGHRTVAGADASPILGRRWTSSSKRVAAQTAPAPYQPRNCSWPEARRLRIMPFQGHDPGTKAADHSPRG
jgi:hypothetical protein